MKKISIILFVIIALFYTPSSTAQEPAKSLATNGTGKVWITPDRARIFLGVESLAETIEAARKKNASIMNKIMAELKSLKIKDLLVQSPAYNVSLIKEDEYKAKREGRLPKLIGYNVTQNFTVLLKNDDVSVLSKNSGLVIDTALENGANIISQNVLFFKEEFSQEKEEALKLAVKDAISKAEVIAKTAGVKIKGYSNIASNFHFESSPRFYADQVSQMSSPAASSESMASTLIAAKLPVKAGVSINCILE